MYHVFQRFIDHLCESASSDSLRACMAETANALDLHNFAYFSLPRRPKAKPQIITTYPEAWATHYMNSRYERVDPIVVQALGNTEPFEWGLELGQTRLMSEPQRQFMDEAAEFGIRCGFTVPIHDSHGPISAVTFVADEHNVAAFRRRIEEHRRVLQLMSMYFDAHVRRKLVPGRKIDNVHLSPRELECLEWAAEGKSAWEIGGILGISRHTAAFHLENVKTKLGVRTILQAVARLSASNTAIE